MNPRMLETKLLGFLVDSGTPGSKLPEPPAEENAL
jgi:hypothetical protein